MDIKKINWPNNAKTAVMITVNLDAEYFWLSLAPDCVNRPKTLSMGQYGMTRGLERLLDVFYDFKIKATFFVPGKVAEIYKDYMKLIVSKGHEIAHHGYEHENYAMLSSDEQRISIEKGIKAIEENCGVTPVGFRAPEGELTLETLNIAKELGIKYSSSLSNDDRPYKLKLNDNNDTILEIPIHWALFDLPYFAFNYRPAFPKGQGRIANYSQVLKNWIEEYNGYYEQGLCYVLQLDPQTIGTPGRIPLVEELLEYINKLGHVWFATGSDIVNYWL
jgi:peptidoglycan/xylan/chitin deacetylase (PgdA/CDA1 family)